MKRFVFLIIAVILSATIGLLLFLDGGATGECIEGDCQSGHGTMLFADGATYVGNWSSGQFNGIGKFQTESSTYSGHFLKGKLHGQGRKEWSAGAYEGSFNEGDYEGVGTMKYSNGDVYEGEWEANKQHGKGEYRYLDGNYYRGEWANGKRHGIGEAKTKQFGVVKGKWEAGSLCLEGNCVNGIGKILYTIGGSHFSGSFKGGTPHGIGVYHKSDGTIIEGSFRYGQFEGPSENQ